MPFIQLLNSEQIIFANPFNDCTNRNSSGKDSMNSVNRWPVFVFYLIGRNITVCNYSIVPVILTPSLVGEINKLYSFIFPEIPFDGEITSDNNFTPIGFVFQVFLKPFGSSAHGVIIIVGFVVSVSSF